MSEERKQHVQAFLLVCKSGDKDELTRLIKNEGANPSMYEMKNNEGKTPAHIVCRYGHIDLLQLLVEVYGCSCNIPDLTGNLPIHDACYYDQLVVLDYLIFSATNPVDDLLALDHEGNTPFHKAHHSGSLSVIRYITDMLVNINSMKLVLFLDEIKQMEMYSEYHYFPTVSPEPRDEYYPPFVAVNVNKLSDSEEDSNSDSDNDDLPEKRVLYFVLANKAGDTPLTLACRHGHLEVVKFYFEFSLIHKAIHLTRLIHVANQCGHADIVCYLHKKGNCAKDCLQAYYYGRMFQPFCVCDPLTREKYIVTRNIDPSRILAILGPDAIFQVLSKSKVTLKLMIKHKPKRWCLINLENLHISLNTVTLYSMILRYEFDSKSHFYRMLVKRVPEKELHSLLQACCIVDSVQVLKELMSIHIKRGLTSNDENLLHTACEWGATQTVKFLVFQRKFDINSVNKLDETPLHVACRHGRSEVAEVLLKAKCDVNTQSSDTEETPLHVACSIKDDSIAYILLGVSELKTQNTIDKFGDTPIFNACRIGSVDLVKLMIDKGCDPMHVNDKTGDIPSHVACRMKRLDILRVLLERFNERVNHQNYFDETLLCVAMNNKAQDIIEFLARKKVCDIFKPLYHTSNHLCLMDYPAVNYDNPLLNQPKSSQDTALHVACKEGDFEIVQILVNYSSVTIENRVKNTPVHIAATANNPLILNCLLQTLESCGHILDSFVNENGNTALHLACMHGSTAAAKLLISYCSVTFQNKKLDTPIHLACQHGHTEVVEYLLTKRPPNKKCDDYRNSNGDTFLLAACKADQYDIASCLLNYCSALCRDNHGNSSIHVACIRKHATLLSILLDGVQPTDSPFVNNDGSTYLHLASKNEAVECMKVLLNKGYKTLVNIPDNDGNTPLHITASVSVVEPLLEIQDCDANRQNKIGNTPLHIACSNNGRAVIRLLVESDKCKESLKIRNLEGHTPLYYVSGRDLVNCLIINGADPKDVSDSRKVRHIKELFRTLKGEHPLNPTITALVLGNSLAGKTTLIKSLTETYDWEQVNPSIGQVERTHEHTAGVEMYEYKVFKEHLARVLFYDFAGQPEFESTHSVLLKSLLSFSQSSDPSPLLIIIVVDIMEPDHITQLKYWAKFIENCLSMSVYPEVIVIGSHVDKIKNPSSSLSQIKQRLIETMDNLMKSNSVCFVENPIFLDCRQTTGEELQKLNCLLLESTKTLLKRTELDVRSHILFAYLYEHFPNKPVKFSDLQRSLRKRTLKNVSELPFTQNNLVDLLTAMHCRQHILLFGDKSTDFWILTAKAQCLMFKEVNGLLFANETFKEHIEIESNVGILSSSLLQRTFPKLDYELLQEFLVYSELCKKIEDQKTLELIERSNLDSDMQNFDTVPQTDNKQGDTKCYGPLRDQSSTNNPVEYFFFPGLIKETRKHLRLWRPSDNYSYTSYWYLQCAENNFFNPIFLQVLLLRLTFQFATLTESQPKGALHRGCLIWKNGLSWSTQGVEVLIEMINQNQELTVFIRSLQDSELETVKLRSSVLKEINEVKRKYCPASKTTEFIIVDPVFDENGSLVPPLKHVSLEALAKAISSSKPQYHVLDNTQQYHHINKNLLCLEPYAGIGSAILSSIFNVESTHEVISENMMSKIFSLLSKAGAQKSHIEHMKKLVLQLNKPVVYQTLRDLFNLYSLFHGRDPRLCKMAATLHT